MSDRGHRPGAVGPDRAGGRLRLGILSDIHANLEALDAALAFCQEQEVSEYLCLGDIVGYGADPDLCVERIRGLRCRAVAGNHDYAVVNRTSVKTFNEPARQAIYWTRERITAETREFLESLELVEAYRSFLLVHASPSGPGNWDYVLSLADAELEFSAFSEPACLVGHTHVPLAVRRHDYRSRAQRIVEPEFEIAANARYLINCGSVGQPRDGDPRLCVVLFDTRTNLMSFHRLSYDVGTAQRKIISAGLPVILAQRLSQGY
ncbi:MAG: metallophosphoesterase family protein [candidate division WOR-3 bacterium]